MIAVLAAYTNAFISRRHPETEDPAKIGDAPPSYKTAPPEEWLKAEHLIVRAPASQFSLRLVSSPARRHSQDLFIRIARGSAMAEEMKGKLPDAWTDADDRSVLKLLCENQCFGMMGVGLTYWTNPTKHVRCVAREISLQVSVQTGAPLRRALALGHARGSLDSRALIVLTSDDAVGSTLVSQSGRISK